MTSSCSREDSPDWLRSFQAPTHSVLTLSSGSESSLSDSLFGEEEKNDNELSPERTSQFPVGEKDQSKPSSSKLSKSKKSPAKKPKEEQTSLKKKISTGNRGEAKAVKPERSQKNIEVAIGSVWALSSDSDSPSTTPKRETPKGKSPRKGTKTKDTVPKNKKGLNSDDIKKEDVGNDGVESVLDDVAEKHIESRFSSSRLPLVLSDKVTCSKALVECEGDSIDLSGDVGAVGRVVVSDEMFLDLKGTIYKTTIVPSRTFCVVSFGPSEAKIEAIMNDFVQLKPQSNVYEAETMVEGTLDGFLFDSDDEADKVPKATTDQNEGNGEKSTAKTDKKKAEKTIGVVRKRGKAAGGKAPKKAKTKAQASKKGKSKK